MLPIDLQNLPSNLPSTDELPCSDETPVDNEEQNLLPNVLLFLLNSLWADRSDWFFAVDMAVYHTTGENPRVPVVPDAFLSLGVDRKKGGKWRKSYAVWEENGVVPILVLEMVSQTLRGEYDEKMSVYAKLGVLYYVVYNPEFWRRHRHQPFEVYQLVAGEYELQSGEPFWMPEVGLGIGRSQTVFGSLPQEQLAWFDDKGDRHLSEAELERQQKEVERQQKEVERQRREQLEAFLRSQGFDPDHLPGTNDAP